MEKEMKMKFEHKEESNTIVLFIFINWRCWVTKFRFWCIDSPKVFLKIRFDAADQSLCNNFVSSQALH